MIELVQEDAAAIAELNDRFRKGDLSLGQWVLSEAVSKMSRVVQIVLCSKIQFTDRFTKDNDPWGEHDFGSVLLDSETYFWKISYYDKDLEYGSEDPANPDITHRVLTVMHRSEY
jgi:hypothetical protein